MSSVCGQTIAMHTVRLALFFGLLFSSHLSATENPGFGRVITSEELLALPPHVFADGTGLPVGSGDAVQGMQLYAEHCSSCHGSVGQGGRALELVGDRALLTTNIPDKGIAVYWPYAPTLFEYIRRAMPPENPYSLGVNEVYAIIAYLLELNELSAPGQLVDAAFLSDLKMPNVDGFRSKYD